MQYGEYIVHVVKEDGTNGDFFTGSQAQCCLVKFGIEMCGRLSRMEKLEVVTVNEEQSGAAAPAPARPQSRARRAR